MEETPEWDKDSRSEWFTEKFYVHKDELRKAIDDIAETCNTPRQGYPNWARALKVRFGLLK